jgi:hypothetical protein
MPAQNCCTEILAKRDLSGATSIAGATCVNNIKKAGRRLQRGKIPH